MQHSITDKTELIALLEKIPATRVLVVGDVMLDRYWSGSASRLSPEAPVPVVALKRVTHLPGGAANVAANIAALGGEVILIGAAGADEGGGRLREALRERGMADDGLITFSGRPTTTKTRVLVHNQQIARVDDETSEPLTGEEERQIIEEVNSVIDSADAVVLSDYAKGCLTEKVLAAVIDAAGRHGKTVIVDPKSRDMSRYSRATFLTPNLSEALQAAGLDGGGEEMADTAAARILADTAVEWLLITLGEHGMKLFRTGDQPMHFPSMARQVFDVTGAGDTVVALLAAALAAGAETPAATTLANLAAGLAVEKVGTTVVTRKELKHSLAAEDTYL